MLALILLLLSEGKAMGVAQHHDAVSGTAKQHVTNDYARKLANGWQHCQVFTDLISSASVFMQHLLTESCLQVLVSNSLASLSGSSAPRVYCDLLNVSVCSLTESSKKVLQILDVVDPHGAMFSLHAGLFCVRSPLGSSSQSPCTTRWLGPSLGPSGCRFTDHLT